MAKKKVIALHVITRVITPGEHGNKEKGIPPKKPKTQDIQPGTHFMLEETSDEYAELKAAGAIRDFNAQDAAAFKQFTDVLNETNAPVAGEDDGTASVKTTTAKTTAKKAAAATEGTTAKAETKTEGDGSELV